MALTKFHFSGARLIISLAVLTFIYLSFFLFMAVDGGNTHRFLLTATLTGLRFVLGERRGESTPDYDRFQAARDEWIGPEFNESFEYYIVTWLSASIVLALPTVIWFSFVNPARYAARRTRALSPVRMRLARPDYRDTIKLVASIVEKEAASLGIRKPKIFYRPLPDQTERFSLNMFAIGDSEQSALFLNQDLLGLIHDLRVSSDNEKERDRQLRVIGKLIQHELWHIKDESSNKLFAVRAAITSLVFGMFVVAIPFAIMFGRRSPHPRGFVAGIQDGLGTFFVVCSIVLAVSVLPFHFGSRWLANRYDEKVWRRMRLSQTAWREIRALVETNKIKVKQGKGLPYEFKLLGLEGDTLRRRAMDAG